jgi:magnesium transporter
MTATLYCRTDGVVRAAGSGPASPTLHELGDPALIWIDLVDPSRELDALVEGALNIDAPTMAERAAMEDSARFFEDAAGVTFIASILHLDRTARPVLDQVAFILAAGPPARLVTVRGERGQEARAFRIGKGRASARIERAASAQDVFVALLEGLIERIADLVETARAEVDELARDVFESDDREPNLREVLKTLGRHGRLVSKARDSLSSLQRLATYALALAQRQALDAERIKAFARDVHELERQCEALGATLTYVLDATLGLVSANQNTSIKVMSVVSLLLLPPTLIASIFGMNFAVMPELQDPNGYYVALAAMLGASAGLYGLGKWRGWF